MAKEYIERDVAIEKTEAFCDVFVTQWTDEKVLAWIRNLPTADVVEVVRCKDCHLSCYVQGAIGESLFCTYWNKDTDEEGYCHEGG